MAFGPESCILIDSTGMSLGTASNPLYVTNFQTVLAVASTNHRSPDAVVLIDTTGTPLATPTNPIQLTALN